jgi:(R,R)-butanediol dehydrogenase/meso-butanediol dehydrogenase/diacetyl reductase
MGERAVVLGTGPIGLGVIAFLKHAGASLIVATEIKERRMEVAKKLGADYVFNPRKTPDLKGRVFEITGNRGVDTVFDCSGVAQAFLSATTFLKRGGQILIKGIITKDVPINPFDFAMNEWRLQGSWAYYFEEFPLVVEFLGKGISPVEEMITKKIKLMDVIKDGFDVLAGPENNDIKIIVSPVA